ncbi:uncharacterized protein LOC135399943 [Ornithodoros turicata]|uniref:uncharacterized protein LOC135399943 n=1 Tax=Ornithodoros turicata TaxID=34597 RepID=UPI00313A0543
MPDQDFKRSPSRDPCSPAEGLVEKHASHKQHDAPRSQHRLTVDFLKTGVDMDGDCGYTDAIPAWFDREKHERAREIFREHFFSFFFCHLMGLAMAVMHSSLLKPLLHTGQSSSLPSLYRRYLNTLRKVKLWYEGDIWTPGDPAFCSIASVRRMHNAVALQLNGATKGCPVTGAVYLSQLDMVITQFAFIGLAAIHPHRIGLFLSDEDFECVLHFWRGVGYKLGIHDKYNLCSGSLKDTIQTCLEVQEQIMKPALVNASEEGIAMSKNIIMAVRVLVVFLSYEGMMKFWTSIFGLKLNAMLSLYDWWSYLLMKLTFAVLLRYKFFRDIFNYLLRIAIKRGVKLGDHLQGQLQRYKLAEKEYNLGCSYRSDH